MGANAGAPGDGLVPEANMAFDRSRLIAAPPEAIWPWLVQLGKQRAGWYLPRAAERFVPRDRRAARRIEERWQHTAVGDRIPDYGGTEAELELAVRDEPRALIYRDERAGATFSWAILLQPIEPELTRVRLRFRGRLASTGLRRRAIVGGGEIFDAVTGELMLRGLEERAREGPSPRAAR